MASDRPYKGMELDDMERRLDRAEQELVSELKIIDAELPFRKSSARNLKLQQRVTRLLESFVSGSHQNK